jgi:hypothetical protein
MLSLVQNIIHRWFFAVCRHTKSITHVVQLLQSFGYLTSQRKSLRMNVNVSVMRIVVMQVTTGGDAYRRT